MAIMKNRFLCAAAAALMTLCLLMSLSAPAYAETVKVTDAESLANALYGRSGVIQADADAIDGWLTDAFAKYPVLGFDFDGYEGEIVGDTITMRMAYRDAEMLPVRYADSREALMAVVAEAAVYSEEEIHLMMPASLRDMDFAEAMTEAFTDSVLARSMLTGRSWEIWVNGYTDSMYVALYLEYETDTESVRQYKQKTEEEAVRLAESLYYRNAPDPVLALLVHDALINRCEYGSTEYTDAENHSAYGVLVNGYAVCEGYAEAFQLMMDIAGIECLYVEGDIIRGERHGWNLIRLEDGYYHVDLTWDDPVSDSGEDYLLYDYLLIPDETIRNTHVWDDSAYPAANGFLWTAKRAQAELSQQSQPVAFAVDYTPVYSADAVQGYETKWSQVLAAQMPKDTGGDVPPTDTTAPVESTGSTMETTETMTQSDATDALSSSLDGNPTGSDTSATAADPPSPMGTPSRWAVYLVSAMIVLILLGVLYAKYLH